MVTICSSSQISIFFLNTQTDTCVSVCQDIIYGAHFQGYDSCKFHKFSHVCARLFVCDSGDSANILNDKNSGECSNVQFIADAFGDIDQYIIHIYICTYI